MLIMKNIVTRSRFLGEFRALRLRKTIRSQRGAETTYLKFENKSVHTLPGGFDPFGNDQEALCRIALQDEERDWVERYNFTICEVRGHISLNPDGSHRYDIHYLDGVFELCWRGVEVLKMTDPNPDEQTLPLSA